MKKIILHSLALFCIAYPVLGYADCTSQTCKISDGPAPALVEYFTNAETVTWNIIDDLWNAQTESEEEVKAWRSKVLARLSSMMSFDNYFSSFDFKIALPITQEFPAEVQRDYDALSRESEELRNILTRSEKRGIWGTPIPSICQWVSDCPFGEGGASARDYLTRLIENNQKITELYTSSILDKSGRTSRDSYILVSDNFRSEIESYYNKDTLSGCSACEGGFTDRIRESMQNIWSLNSQWRQWIQNWKNAWALMRWGSATPWYADTEALLLSEYLDTQWISGDQAGVVIENLEKYGSWWLTASNPLFNSANYLQNGFEDEVRTFEETVNEKLWEDGENKVWYNEITRVEVWIQESSDISASIATLYEEQLPAAQVQDTSSQALQSRIIRMHFTILQAIDSLHSNVRRAQEVCNKAGSRWRCEY